MCNQPLLKLMHGEQVFSDLHIKYYKCCSIISQGGAVGGLFSVCQNQLYLNKNLSFTLYRTSEVIYSFKTNNFDTSLGDALSRLLG